MSSGSSANTSKKRKNRWGAPPPRSVEPQNEVPPSSSHHIIPKDNVQEVSEEDAIAALIASASKKEEQKQPKRDYKYGNNNNNSNINHAQSSRNNRTFSGNGGTSNNSNRWGSKKSQSGSGVVNTAAAANNNSNNPAPPEAPKEKANFGLSGALAKDSQTGNIYKGVLLKFSEPQEARVPKTRWRFYVFKKKQQQPSFNNDPKEGEELLEVLHISQQSAYLFGKDDEICDVVLHHSSISKQHCVLQYRALPDRNSGKLLCKPYLMDLDSTNGTFINGERLDSARYYELRKRDVVTLGGSTREYVLLTENTTG